MKRLLREEPDGHLLVFLPGGAEIRWCAQKLGGLADSGVDVLPLHGDLKPEEQDRAVRPSSRRKVILSTNVAETSVTIDGVVAVVDSGLARIASHSPWSGLPTLEVRKISRAAAAQRAGRAGRTRAGRAVRLYTRHDHDARPAYETPEVEREDLSEPFLALAGLGVLADPAGFEWFEPPPAPAAEAARALLGRLGAVEPGGAITPLGRRLLALPAHPRLARLAVEAADRGAAEGGALLAALLGERDLRDRRNLDGAALPATGPSDLLELMSLFEEAARARFDPDRCRRLGVNAGAAQAVERGRRQLRAALRVAPGVRPVSGEAAEGPLLLATLAAYPDRVARRRARGSDEVVLTGGGSARLEPVSVVREAELLVAIDAEERRGDRPRPGQSRAEARVRLASAVTQEMLLDLFPGALRYDTAVAWNAQAERVEATERLLYEDLVLEESRATHPDAAAVAARLADEARRPRGARLRAGGFARPAHGPAGAGGPLRPRPRRHAAGRGGAAGGAGGELPGPPQLRRAARGRPARRPARPPARPGAGGAGPAGAGAGDAAGRARRPGALRGRQAPLDREPAAGLLLHGPGAGGGQRRRPAHAPPAGAQPAGGAGDQRPGRLLGPPLPGPAPRARPPLPPPRLARGPPHRAGAPARPAPRRRRRGPDPALPRARGTRNFSVAFVDSSFDPRVHRPKLA